MKTSKALPHGGGKIGTGFLRASRPCNMSEELHEIIKKSDLAGEFGAKGGAQLRRANPAGGWFGASA